ncbi:MAG TPA: protein kinase, partial [Planctomycetota bacterium]|nr:protein kinase [Planctomycetota bacterium]
MTDAGEALEGAVEQFLDRREREPRLSPEQFAAEHPEAGPRLLSALHAAMRVLDTFSDGTPAQPAQIGPYRVVREIGRGGMGVVYEVEHDGVRLAMKRLHAPWLGDRHTRERFAREARALQRVRHPGIVRIVDVGEADEQPFLVLELVDGRSLAEQAAMPWRDAATLVQRVAEALADVHRAGLCHRDLKPANVLLRDDGSPVLVDFGLVHDDRDVTLTGTGDLVGTPRYLAPEQVDASRADARTDVFALGLLLAELLNGRPVREESDWQHLRTRVPRGERPAFGPQVPTSIVRIVHTALARAPRRRFADAAGMAAELERALAGKPLTARPPGPLLRSWDWLVLHPRQSGVLATAVVTLAIGGAVAWRHHTEQRQHEQAQASFQRGVEAWLRQDVAVAREAATDGLDHWRAHDGAALLLALCSSDPATATLPDTAREPSLRLALQSRQQGRWVEASDAMATACRLDPGCALGHVLLAEVAGHAGNFGAAADALAAAARIMPDSAVVLEQLGQARLRAKDVDGAVAALQRASQLEPDNWRLHHRLARALYANDAAAGLREIDRAKELLGSDRSSSWLEVRTVEASLLDKAGRTAE